MPEEFIHIQVDIAIRSKGKNWVVDVSPCLACGKEHKDAPLKLFEDRVWYQCGKGLVYIRDQKKK